MRQPVVCHDHYSQDAVNSVTGSAREIIGNQQLLLAATRNQEKKTKHLAAMLAMLRLDGVRI